MQIHSFPICFQYSSLFLPTTTRTRIINSRTRSIGITGPYFLRHANFPNLDSSTTSLPGGDARGDDYANLNDVDVDEDDDDDDDDKDELGEKDDEAIEIEIEKTGNNSRRIRAKVTIEASLQTVWNILTDYEKLSDFIPGLALSQLLEKKGNFARLYQIGQQELPFGLSFNAKGIVDCYEKPLEDLPVGGRRRDIEFKMIEGDFQLFEGKWSIEQRNTERCEGTDSSSVGREILHTSLSYVVDVKPKLWLPVRLVEGRLCREIKVNLSCIRVEAQKTNQPS